jgi:hypothetical protein
MIEIAGGRKLNGFETRFGRGSADDKRQVIRRATGGSQCFHFFRQEFFQAARV